MIELNDISKTYRVARRGSGFGKAVKALFSREYETIRALDNISFQVGDGEIVGYIGPNGAGKSTTVKIMCGILTPDSGTCLINGKVPWKERRTYVRDIGVVFGQRTQLWWDVPVIDSFELFRDMYKIPEAVYKKNLDEMVAILDLEKILQTPVRNLSLGQRMRCEIAAPLLHDPKVLFLDEPTIGLDAVSKLAVRDFIKKVNKERGTTVVLTTHDMSDIEALTERVLLIGHGKLLLDGTLEEMKKHASTMKQVTVKYTGQAPVVPAGLRMIDEKDGTMTVAVDPTVLPVSEAISALAAGTELTDITVTDISTDEMVASLYKEFDI